MANDPSLFEYELKDCAFAAVSLNGARFPFSDRVSGATDSPNGTSGIGKGSGVYPRFHHGVTYEPSVSITVPKDEAAKFKKWFKVNCAADGVCHLEARRTKPRVASITDLALNWLPIVGDTEYAEGSPTEVEISGNYLEPREDTTNGLAV